MAKTNNFKTWYFTFGTDGNFPYQGGWVEIEAPDGKKACEIFRILFPNRMIDGKRSKLLNCAFVYNEEEFEEAREAFEKYPDECCHMHYGLQSSATA